MSSHPPGPQPRLLAGDGADTGPSARAANSGPAQSLPHYGSGVLRLYDTALGSVRELALREPGKVSMYVCGPTVYDVPHIGHGRFTLVWDIMRRYLEWSGYEVRYVSNITDIEDKIIRRAAEDGVSTDEIVKTYEKAWWDAVARLDVRPPDAEPHATEYVERMVDYIAGLIDRRHADETADGVYFDVGTLD